MYHCYKSSNHSESAWQQLDERFQALHTITGRFICSGLMRHQVRLKFSGPTKHRGPIRMMTRVIRSIDQSPFVQRQVATRVVSWDFPNWAGLERNSFIKVVADSLFKTPFCFRLIFKIHSGLNVRRLRSPVRRAVETDSWLRSGSSSGAFLPQSIMAWQCPFCEGLKEVKSGTEGALTLTLNQSLTHFIPLDCQPETLVCLVPIVFSWLPHIILVTKLCLFLNPKPLCTFSSDILFHWGS